jgi:hypothetical protein
MHGGGRGPQKRLWSAGRGFGARRPLGTPEPTDEETTADDEPSSPPAWGEVHAALMTDYEGRLAAHAREAARFNRAGQERFERQQAQRQQSIATGDLGLKIGGGRPPSRAPRRTPPTGSR